MKSVRGARDANKASRNRRNIRGALDYTSPAPVGLALASLLLCTTPVSAADTDQQQPEKETVLPTLGVEDASISQGYTTKKASSIKYTSPIADTPQTITVVPAQVMREQNLLSLRDVLSTVPGITFGAGEGGGGYGDSVTLRGYSANADITTDGLRDSAQYTRSDSFNVQQVEVINGSSSAYSGVGSVGGVINLVSKAPVENVFTTLSGSAGTDAYGRLAIDTNQRLGDSSALRVNAVWHQNDVPGRDVERNKRWGLAPSVTLGLNEQTSFTLSYVHMYDNNTPQYGVPYFFNAFLQGPLPGVSSENYYGYRNIDKQRSDQDTITAKLSHKFSDTLELRNITRWQQVKQLSIVDPPQGVWCIPDPANPAASVNAATGTPAAASATTASCIGIAPNTYLLSGPRGNSRDTVNKMIVSQFDAISEFATGPLRHTLVVGGAISHESFALDTGNVLRNPNGAAPNPALANMNILNPDNVYTGPVNYVRSARQKGSQDNQAVYAFDTIRLSRHFELNGGIRWEHNKGDFTSAAYNAQGVFTLQTPVFENEENLFSYRVGLVYKPVRAGSIYVAYGNAKTPSKASVNGTCTTGTFGTTTGTQAFVNNCNVDPEKAKTYEVGVKWQFMEDKLLATAAFFRNERTNFRVASGDPTIPSFVLDGASRVDGIALGLSGNLTPEWQMFTNYTYLKSKVLRSVSRFTTNGGGLDLQAGNPLPNVPDHAASVWTTYILPHGFTVGYGITYQGRFYLNSTAPLYKADSYWLHRAMVTYDVNDRASIQLNINNLTDKLYYTRIRTNAAGWATPGEGRSFVATFNYMF